MALRVLVLDRINEKGGREEYRTLFFYPLNPQITVNGVVVVPTPSTKLPIEATYFNMLTDQELTSIDSGTWFFETVIVNRNPGEGLSVLLTRAQQMWNNRVAVATQRLRNRFIRAGMRVEF